MKKSTVCQQVLSAVLAMGIAPLLSSCDDASQPKKEESEKEPKEATEVEGAAEGEGLEAASEALKKKEEESQEESEVKKEKGEEKKSGGESLMKASPGMKKR